MEKRNIEDELSKILSDELAKSIDAHILKTIINLESNIKRVMRRLSEKYEKGKS